MCLGHKELAQTSPCCLKGKNPNGEFYVERYHKTVTPFQPWLCLSFSSSVQDTAHRSAPDAELAGDSRFIRAGVAQLADLIGVERGSERSAEALAVQPGVSQPGACRYSRFQRCKTFGLTSRPRGSGHTADGHQR
jgi:hypothetical protein